MQDTQSKQILVIEDDEVSRNLLVEHLVDCGFTVLSAEDGLKGLWVLKEHTPDLILLDLMMPRYDGYTFLTKFKEQYINLSIPIIVVSALSDIENVKKAISLGASAYITKPINLSSLNDKINKLLNIKSSFSLEYLDLKVSYKDSVFIVYLKGPLHKKEALNIKSNIMDSISNHPEAKPVKIILDLNEVKADTLNHESINALFDFYCSIEDIEPENIKLSISNEEIVQILNSHPVGKFFEITSKLSDGFEKLKNKE